MQEMRDRSLGPKEKNYNNGESFLYLGNAYPIHISQDPDITQDYAVFEGDILHINVKKVRG